MLSLVSSSEIGCADWSKIKWLHKNGTRCFKRVIFLHAYNIVIFMSSARPVYADCANWGALTKTESKICLWYSDRLKAGRRRRRIRWMQDMIGIKAIVSLFNQVDSFMQIYTKRKSTGPAMDGLEEWGPYRLLIFQKIWLWDVGKQRSRYRLPRQMSTKLSWLFVISGMQFAPLKILWIWASRLADTSFNWLYLCTSKMGK